MITAINNNQNFTGKFKIEGSLTQRSREYLEEFIQMGTNGVSNKRFLSRKSYDIFARQGDSQSRVELRTKMNTPSLKKPTEVYISTLHPEENIKEQDFNYFRSSLNWFESYKRRYNGYNNWFEKIISYIKG